MSGNHLIAVCDILGFSRMVQEYPLAAVVGNALEWFRKALNHCILNTSFPSAVPPTRDLDANPRVGAALFSDTVLLYTKEGTDDAVRELINVVANLLFETIIEGTTRIRGGVAYGEVHIDPDNSVFVGRPVIEACRLEKDQQWAGAALTETAIERLPNDLRFGRHAGFLVTHWNVPLHNGGICPTLAVNWNNGVHTPDRLRWSSEFDWPPTEAWMTDASVCEKFVNTRRFHEAHCVDCKRVAARSPLQS